jgi:hypothetical protein
MSRRCAFRPWPDGAAFSAPHGKHGRFILHDDYIDIVARAERAFRHSLHWRIVADVQASRYLAKVTARRVAL